LDSKLFFSSGYIGGKVFIIDQRMVCEGRKESQEGVNFSDKDDVVQKLLF
jgi:hypothetical protein